MNKRIAIPSVAACLILSACYGDDKNETPAAEPSQFTGTWVSAAYGNAIVVENNDVSYYQFTSDYCIRSEQASDAADALADDFWVLSDDALSMRQKLDVHGIDIRRAVYTKSDALPESCVLNLIPIKGGQEYEQNLSRDFELFWQTFNEYYPSFERRNIDWQALRDGLPLPPENINDPEQLYDAIVNMIEPLEDGHVELISEDGAESDNFDHDNTFYSRFTEEYIDENGEIENDEDAESLQRYAEEQQTRLKEIRVSYTAGVEQLKQAANKQVTWYVTTDNIGFLSIDSMDFFISDDIDEFNPVEELDALRQAMDEAMADLADTDGIIVDIRMNSGGFDGASQLIARYFLDQERTPYSKQARLGDTRTEPEEYTFTPVAGAYTKPVVLLTSAFTVSAAEIFTLIMRDLPHVTLAGEPTQGTLSDILSKQLPSGLHIDLVNEYYLTPTGEWFESVGIPVDHHIEFGTLEQREAGIDEGIEAAHDLLIQ